MKLPTEKKDRMLVFVSLGIGAIALLFAAVQLGLRPFMNSWRTAEAKRAEIQERVTKAETELAKMPQRTVTYSNLQSQIEMIAQMDILQPVLGTFLLGVRETVENMAQECNVKIETVREVGILDIPGKRENRERVFKSYGVQVSGWASFEGLCGLIGRLEDSNPFLCVSSIQISAQPDDPETHRIGFNLEWPIWKNPDMGSAKQRTGEPPAHE